MAPQGNGDVIRGTLGICLEMMVLPFHTTSDFAKRERGLVFGTSER